MYIPLITNAIGGVQLFRLVRNFIKGHHAINKKIYRFAKIRNNIPHTAFCDASAVAHILADYDVLIAGSDQIWNPCFCHDENYFLPFGKGAISYAASIGKSELNEEEESFILQNLVNIDYISVREEHDAKKLSRAINKDVEVVLDPTLLIGPDFWKKVVSKVKNTTDYESYDVFYILGDMKKYIPVVNKSLADGKRVKIISLYNRPEEQELSKNTNIEVVLSAGPIQFVNIIQGASNVYTDSFHATAFACMLEKQFVVFPKGLMNERIHTLLNVFNLKEHFLEIEVFLKNGCARIDYNKLENTYEKKRKESGAWLQNAIDSLCGGRV